VGTDRPWRDHGGRPRGERRVRRTLVRLQLRRRRELLESGAELPVDLLSLLLATRRSSTRTRSAVKRSSSCWPRRAPRPTPCPISPQSSSPGSRTTPTMRQARRRGLHPPGGQRGPPDAPAGPFLLRRSLRDVTLSTGRHIAEGECLALDLDAAVRVVEVSGEDPPSSTRTGPCRRARTPTASRSGRAAHLPRAPLATSTSKTNPTRPHLGRSWSSCWS